MHLLHTHAHAHTHAYTHIHTHTRIDTISTTQRRAPTVRPKIMYRGIRQLKKKMVQWQHLHRKCGYHDLLSAEETTQDMLNCRQKDMVYFSS
jgi:hypothetical protein